MEQDLFDWLNSHANTKGTGLLVAPLNPVKRDDIPAPDEKLIPEKIDLPSEDSQEGEIFAPESPTVPEEISAQYGNDTQRDFPGHDSHGDSAVNITQEDLPGYSPNDAQQEFPRNDSHGDSAVNIPRYAGNITQEDSPRHSPNDTQQDFPGHDSRRDSAVNIQRYAVNITQEDSPAYSPQSENDIQPENFADDAPPYDPAESHDSPPEYYAQDSQDDSAGYSPQYDSDSPDEELLHDHDWQERATGFTLSLDEPPPELWTHINDDDPEPDYEPTDSLQGAAYVQIHGRNFTERLHHTLKHRKERAQSEQEPEKPKHYMQKAIIFCGCLLMTLGFAVLALWFVWRETPDGMKRRAESFIEAGNFDEAAEIYRRAHRRYPDIPDFLAGLSESSQKAGHVQTAKTAHDEYIRLTLSDPDNPPAKPQTVTEIPRKPETETPAKPAPVSLILMEKPLTFQDYLNEANHAYNIGMYNRAVINFFRAMEINGRDIRPYLGLSASYRMKGMYFDSQRILDEARRKFGRSPALDMELHFLREAK